MLGICEGTHIMYRWLLHNSDCGAVSGAPGSAVLDT